MTKQSKKDVLMDHEYDGIQELDNDLPPWWLWLFYITIIWAFIYMIHYHVIGTGDSSAVEYLKEIDPNWEESTAKAGLSLEYRSPLYQSSEELTPLARVQQALAEEKEMARLLAEKKATGCDSCSGCAPANHVLLPAISASKADITVLYSARKSGSAAMACKRSGLVSRNCFTGLCPLVRHSG